jgi:hypothetical protein
MISTIVRIQLVDGDQEGYLDVMEGTAFPITKSISDIRDVSSRSGSFSKTIKLPGSKNNSLMLNNYFKLNVESGKFDINKIQMCTVIQNGVIVFDNVYLRLMKVVTNENRGEEMYDEIEYEVQIRNSVSDFFKDINNKYLSDLKGWGTFTHDYTVANISDSFTHTQVDGYKYVMPYIEGGNEYSIQEFMPGIYAKQYFDRIHQQNGYSYEWDSISASTIQFDKLIIPYGGDVKKISDDVMSGRIIEADKLGFEQRVEIFQDLYGLPSTSAKVLEVSENEVDPLDLYSASTSTYDNDLIVNPPSSIQYKVTLDWRLEAHNFEAFDIYNGWWDMDSGTPYEDLNAIRPMLSIRDQVGTVRGTVFLEPDTYNTFGTYYPDMAGVDVGRYEDGYVKYNGSFVIPTNSSRVVCSGGSQSYLINVTDIGPASEMTLHEQLELPHLAGIQRFHKEDTLHYNTFAYRLFVDNISIEIAPSTDSGLLPNSEINLQNFIPKKFLQSNFLKSIYQKYNLYADIDPNNPRNIIYKTRDSFYDDGEVKDFTTKLCKEIPQETFFIPEISSKKLILSYADDDKDPVLTAYKNETNETYAQVEVTFENENVKGIKRNDEKFSSTVNAVSSFGAVLPILSPDFKFNTRIMIDGGAYACNTFKIKESVDDTYSFTSYPYIGLLDKPYDADFSIEYAQPDYYAYDPANLTNNNLYVNHWRRTLSQMNSGKMLKAYFWLTEEDFKGIKLNDILKVKESFFYINKVADYDANSNLPTLIELLTIEDDLRLLPIGRDVKQTQVETNSGVPIRPNRPTGPVIGQQGGLSHITQTRNTITSIFGTGVNTLQNQGTGNNLPNNFRGYVVGDNLFPTESGYYIGGASLTSTKLSLSNDASVLSNGALTQSDELGQVVFKPDGLVYNPKYVGDGYVEPGYYDNPISDIIFTYDIVDSGTTATTTTMNTTKLQINAEEVIFSTGKTIQMSGTSVDVTNTTLSYSGNPVIEFTNDATTVSYDGEKRVEVNEAATTVSYDGEKRVEVNEAATTVSYDGEKRVEVNEAGTLFTEPVSFIDDGSFNSSLSIYTATTTDATVTTIREIPMNDTSLNLYNIKVVGKGAGSQYFYKNSELLIKGNGVSAPTQVNNVYEREHVTSTEDSDIELTTSGGIGVMRIRVTGIIATTFDWIVKIDGNKIV